MASGDAGMDGGVQDAGRLFVQVNLSEDVTCARDLSGVTWCWGDNTWGELGSGADGGSTSAPVQVTVAPVGAQVHPGRDYACAALPGGPQDAGVLCWGRNDAVQLGNLAAGADSPAAVAPDGFDQVPTGLSVGTSHACITYAFDVGCWGANDEAQLGQGSTSTGGFSTQPVSLPGGAPGAIAASIDFSCALDQDAGLSCWGSDDAGQSGQAPSPQVLSPTEVARAPDWVQATLVLGTHHGCLIARPSVSANAGVLECWGADRGGALNGDAGVVTPTNAVDFARPLGATVVGSAAAGNDFTCAVPQLDGGVWCWGDNAAGIIPGSGLTRVPPTEIPFFHGTHPSLHARDARLCVLLNSALWCWGDNANWAAIGAPTPDGGELVVVPTRVSF
jgi:hypothetical protein